MNRRSLLCTVVTAVAVLLAVPTSADAAATTASAPTRAQLAAAVQAVEYENVGGPNFGYYFHKYPTQIDWQTDGCSVPSSILHAPGLGNVLKYYSGVFNHSCVRHDFGYRNYGSGVKNGLRLDPTEARKKTIDNRFHSNLDIQCKSAYSGVTKVVQREACYAAAKIFYDAVATFGGQAFFG